MNKSICRIAAACLVVAAFPAWAQQPGSQAPRASFAEQMFKQMDTNGDGVVSREEYNAFYNKQFDKLDANHDGKISHEEMEAAREQALRKFGERMQEQFNQRFDAADANHDGALSRDEAQKMPQVARHFDEIDADHDGKVTHAEVDAYIKKMRRERKAQP